MMKGYAVTEKGKHGWVEKEMPQARGKDAILRPVAVAPCSSDTHYMHTYEGDEPVILGHEAIAEVVEIGEDVKNFKPGDIVVVSAGTPDWGALGTQTRHGNHIHDHRMQGGFKFLIEKDGVFAEYFHVNNADANLVLLPEGVSVEAALAVTDMATTGFYGVELADVQFGDSVVVFGIGPVGLMAISGAKLRGAGRIYAIGTRPNCVELAKEYGATDIINYKKGNVVDQILELEGGHVDKIILAGGDVSTMNDALQLVAPNGVIANVVYLDEEQSFNIPTYLWGLGMGDISIRGGMCPGGGLRMKKLLNLVQAGRFDPSKIFNYKFKGFDQIPDAFIAMDEKPKDLIKPIVYLK